MSKQVESRQIVSSSYFKELSQVRRRVELCLCLNTLSGAKFCGGCI